jgi:hypothetical protein
MLKKALKRKYAQTIENKIRLKQEHALVKELMNRGHSVVALLFLFYA